jgi:hypothetical protein
MPSSAAPHFVFPNSTDYPLASIDWNQGRSPAPTPSVIIFCTSVADVQQAIRFAEHNGRQVSIRSGRHNYEALSLGTNGIVVIDVGSMQSFTIQPATNSIDGPTMTVGPGMRLFHIAIRLASHGYLWPIGSCPSVAVAGFSLGGGFGYISRKYGLASDTLVNATMVTADGHVVSVNEMSLPDLFWAIRGGGNGDFGIITSLTFRIFPAPTGLVVSQSHLQSSANQLAAPLSSSIVVSSFRIVWSSQYQSSALNAWQHWVITTPVELTSQFAIYAVSGIGIAIGQYLGSVVDLKTMIQPLVSLGDANVTWLGAKDYVSTVVDYAGCGNLADCQAAANSLPQLGPQAISFKAKSLFVYEPLSSVAIQLIKQQMEAPYVRPCCDGQWAGTHPLIDPPPYLFMSL